MSQVQVSAVVVPPPFDECFRPYIPVALSPLVLGLFGASGVGKSNLARLIGTCYQQHGWSVWYLLTEKARSHTLLYPGIDNRLFVSPKDVAKQIDLLREAAIKTRAPHFIIIDSVADLGSDSGRIGARQQAINEIVWEITVQQPAHDIPIILLMLAQERQGNAVPGTTFVASRPSVAASNLHSFHLMVRMVTRRGQDGHTTAMFKIHQHSLALYRVAGEDDQDPRIAPFDPAFHPRETEVKTGDLSGLIQYPTLPYFPAKIGVYAVPVKARRAKTSKEDNEGDNAQPAG